MRRVALAGTVGLIAVVAWFLSRSKGPAEAVDDIREMATERATDTVLPPIVPRQFYRIPTLPADSGADYRMQLVVPLIPQRQTIRIAQVIGGIPVGRETHPEAFGSRPAEGYSKWCSGVQIGPQVFLTAQHCLLDDRDRLVLDIVLRSDTILSTADCKAVSPSRRADVAVCVLDRRFTDYPGVPVWPDRKLKIGDRVELSGVGCNYWGGEFGTFRVAPAPINDFFERDGFLFARTDTTVRTCGGDSGAALYAASSAGRRRIVGIASKAVEDGALSWFLLLSSEPLQDSLRALLAGGITICGMTEDPSCPQRN